MTFPINMGNIQGKEGLGRKEKFSLGYAELEMAMKHPDGNIRQTPQLRKKV